MNYTDYIVDSIGDVEKDFLYDVDRVRRSGKSKTNYAVIIGTAAAAVLILGAAGLLIRHNIKHPSPVAESGITEMTGAEMTDVRRLEPGEEDAVTETEAQTAESLQETEGSDSAYGETAPAFTFGVRLITELPEDIRSAVIGDQERIYRDAVNGWYAEKAADPNHLSILYPFFVYEEDASAPRDPVYFFPVVSDGKVLFSYIVHRTGSEIESGGETTEFNEILSGCFTDNRDRMICIVRHPVDSSPLYESLSEAGESPSVQEYTAEYILRELDTEHSPEDTVFLDLSRRE